MLTALPAAVWCGCGERLCGMRCRFFVENNVFPNSFQKRSVALQHKQHGLTSKKTTVL